MTPAEAFALAQWAMESINGATARLWLTSPTAWLSGEIPIDVLFEDPDRFAVAAFRFAAQFWSGREVSAGGFPGGEN